MNSKHEIQTGNRTDNLVALGLVGSFVLFFVLFFTGFTGIVVQIGQPTAEASIASAESQPAAATTPAASATTTTTPIMPTAGNMRLTVGAVVNFPPNVYNRDYFGCYDIENTKKGYRLYITAVDAAAKNGVAKPELSGVAAVERFVWEHDIDNLPPKPNKPDSDFYTDVCWAMKPFAKKDNAHIVRETAEWDGVGQVACLGPAINLSVNPKRPFCFWTILSMPPTLSR